MKKQFLLFISLLIGLNSFAQTSPPSYIRNQKVVIENLLGDKVTSLEVKGAITDVTKRITLDQLRNLSGRIISESQQFFLTDKGKEGNWRYDPNDITSLDNTGTVIVTKDGKRIKRIYEGNIYANWFGADEDESTVDSKAFNDAFQFAKTLNGTVTAKSGIIYLVDQLVIDGRIEFVGESAGLYRFGGTDGRGVGSLTLKHVSGSSNVMLDLRAGGIGLKNLLLDGNSSPGTILQIYHGFENRIESIRASFGTGIGIDIQGSCNTFYRDIFVDNCGSETLPGVRIGTRTGLNQHTINTIDFYGLTIERCKGVHLDVGREVNTVVSYPEFVRIHNLHVESPTDNGATINLQPLVRFGNCREVTLISPFVYGGPGVLIEHDQTDPGYINVIGGIKLVGGTVLGRNIGTTVENNLQPKTGIKLTRGNFFSVTGTSLDNLGLQVNPQDFLGQAILVDSTYGQDVFLPPTYMMKRASVLVTDLRTLAKPLAFEQENLFSKDILFRGHLRSSDRVQTLTSSILGPSGTGSPAPSLTGNDTNGRVFFGSGASPGTGGMVQVNFSKPYKKEPTIIITAGNLATSSRNIYASVSATGFIIYFGVAATANSPLGTYHVKYYVIE